MIITGLMIFVLLSIGSIMGFTICSILTAGKQADKKMINENKD